MVPEIYEPQSLIQYSREDFSLKRCTLSSNWPGLINIRWNGISHNEEKPQSKMSYTLSQMRLCFRSSGLVTAYRVWIVRKWKYSSRSALDIWVKAPACLQEVLRYC